MSDVGGSNLNDVDVQSSKTSMVLLRITSVVLRSFGNVGDSGSNDVAVPS